MCHLTDGAQRYLARIDDMVDDDLPKCCICSNTAHFRVDGEELFCSKCYHSVRFGDFYRACGLDDRTIFDLKIESI